ncbi:hypothetical protein [Gemmatimonas sp.]|uniref:hypothetical protein n=1 Tax=Gemmatimonas sp. TaxID=1962908 RepID=UPI003982EBD0
MSTAPRAWRAYEQWQGWLDQNVSNREETRLDWLRVMLIGIVGTGALGLVMMLVHLLTRPLDDFARLPIVVTLAVLAYVTGQLGFRYGRRAIAMTALSTASGLPDRARYAAEATGPRTPVKSYTTQAAVWKNQVVQNEWHRDPLLTLTTLATSLDTSPRTLSRTLNEGLGRSFNEFINGLRVSVAGFPALACAI